MNNDQRKSMISVRGCFSESIGKSKCVMDMQYDDFDNRTRTMIINKLFEVLEEFLDDPNRFGCNIHTGYYDNVGNYFCKTIISEVFNKSIVLEEDKIFNWRKNFVSIQKVINEAKYNEILDILWFINSWINDNYYSHNDFFSETFNHLFEKEYVGYRFIDGRIVPITDKCEMEEIEQACNAPYVGCKTHIEKAVGFLADREHKDYKNCIKESISAVESICCTIADKRNATLGEALKILESKCNLKGQLKAAFEKLYAYTNNDKGGIRHAEGLFVSEVSFEEAKFMLVSCCAFVNYLIAEHGKIVKE